MTIADEVINELRNYANFKGSIRFGIALEAAEMIEAALRAQQEREKPADNWIPCSERLPTPGQYIINHNYQEFLVTLESISRERCTERCAFRCGKWWMFNYKCYVDDTEFTAVAWMPKPEPYRGDHIPDATKMVEKEGTES